MKSRLRQGGLYVITDAALLARPQLLPAVTAALRGGAGMVQYRDKSQDAQRRLRQARALLRLCQDHDVPLIINDDTELAAAIDADGVHLGRSDADPQATRKLLGPSAIIGISGYAEPEAALNPAADYIAFGCLFDSPTKPSAPVASLDVLGAARRLTAKPLVGIGGINAANAGQVLAAGADWLAVVSAVFASPDIEAATRRLCQLITQRI